MTFSHADGPAFALHARLASLKCLQQPLQLFRCRAGRELGVRRAAVSPNQRLDDLQRPDTDREFDTSPSGSRDAGRDLLLLLLSLLLLLLCLVAADLVDDLVIGERRKAQLQ